MGKWINVTGSPADRWYVDDQVNVTKIAEAVTKGTLVVQVPLRNGAGEVYIRADRARFIATGEDDT